MNCGKFTPTRPCEHSGDDTSCGDHETSAPAVLVEIAYHDNAEDEAWIKNNITVIAEALTRAVCAYLEMNCAL